MLIKNFGSDAQLKLICYEKHANFLNYSNVRVEKGCQRFFFTLIHFVPSALCWMKLKKKMYKAKTLIDQMASVEERIFFVKSASAKILLMSKC